MTNSSNLHWLNQQIEQWQENNLVDQATAARLKSYYAGQEDKTGSPSALSYALVLLGTTLVLLGVILILAKNWADMPRLARVFCSLLPLLVGFGLGGFTILKEKDRRWSEASALVIAVGLLTGLALNGQIYHVITTPPNLFLSTAVLSLPLVYLFSADITALFYLVMTAIYLGFTATEGSSSPGFYLLAFVLLIGVFKPWFLLQFHKNKLVSQSFWLPFALAGTFFVFITGLMAFDIPVRELYALYFIALMWVDAYLFPNQGLGGRRQLHTLSLLGETGLYVMIYALSYRGMWTYLDKLSMEPLHVGMMAAMLLATGCLAYLLYRREGQTNILPLALPIVIFLFHLWTNQENLALIASVFFNIIFFTLGIKFLIQGIRDDRLGLANQGLLFLVLIIGTRFLDIEFSFLVRGVVFVLLGIGFLVTNLWMVRKKKEVTHEQ